MNSEGVYPSRRGYRDYIVVRGILFIIPIEGFKIYIIFSPLQRSGSVVFMELRIYRGKVIPVSKNVVLYTNTKAVFQLLLSPDRDRMERT